MANEDVTVEDIDGEGEETLSNEPEDTDTTDWKAEAIKARGIATRYRTKLVKATEKKKEPPAANPNPAPQNKQDFDYAEKAYMTSNGIKRDEFAFVKEVMKSTGKSLDEVLDSKYFQAELKERRDAAATAEATPTTSKRSTTATRDTVEYWLAKGELPPADQRELRQKVVNAKIKAAKGSPFSKNPVV